MKKKKKKKKARKKKKKKEEEVQGNLAWPTFAYDNIYLRCWSSNYNNTHKDASVNKLSPSTGLRHPSSNDGAGKRCLECDP